MFFRVRKLSEMTEKMSQSLLDTVISVTGSMAAPLLRSKQGRAFMATVPGEVILREGDAGTAAYIVRSGMLQARVAGRVVSRFGPGEWFGEMSLLTGAARSATVEVVLDCRVMVVDADAFATLVAMYPRLYERLAALLSERLARTSHDSPLRRAEVVVL